MISYAQNFEDVMLERAFKDVVEGFYVDVGAWDPWLDSVTAHFYGRGWRGVNIEPAPAYAQLLRESRPRDVVIQAAADRIAGRRTLHVFSGSGCSSFYGAISADSRLAPYPHSTIEVETVTLNEVFTQHAPPEVHFLKLDCEGAEKAVLEGLDLRRFRPWIILLEAMKPLSQIPSHRQWAPILRANDYKFVYFDGLNRFYVADERAKALKSAFKAPPNIFDGIEFPRRA